MARSHNMSQSGRRASSRSRSTLTLVSRSALLTLGGISERELSVWEHEELIAPARVVEANGRREPLYDAPTLKRVRVIRTLAEELEVNLPGIGIILNLLDRMGG